MVVAIYDINSYYCCGIVLLQMTTIKKLKEGAKKPYSVPLECVITSRSDVIRYKTGGISKTMLFVSLCDATGYIKGSVYDIHRFDDIEDGEGVYMKNYIMKSESCLVITSKTHVMERGKMSVPEELVRESVLLTRPATPPPIDVSLVKKSPVQSTVTVTGKISQVGHYLRKHIFDGFLHKLPLFFNCNY